MTFSEAAVQVATRFAAPEDAKAALLVLGPEAANALEALQPLRRAELVDRYVRNIRTVGVLRATTLQRELLAAVEATPDGVWDRALAGPADLMALRNHVKYVLVALGLGWERMSKLQSCILGLARWAQSTGTATVRVRTEARRVALSVSSQLPESDVAVLVHSPMAEALHEAVNQLNVARDGASVRFEFEIQA